MSLQDRVDEVIPRLRAAQTDLADIEVKLAQGGTPESLPETISAFANGAGGLILLGVDEKAGFTPAEIDAAAVSTAVAGYCRDSVEPAVVADIDVVRVDGQRVVAALLRRLRATRGAVFEDTADADVLRFAQVLDRDRAEERVTLAGLLALGRYPQQFFPQLDITFVVFPTTRPGVQMADGTRFLDNASLDGPIPLMIEQALAVVRRNMTRRAVIQGFGREDRWEYPEEVVRELLGNAVMHRDYHPLTHGSQIRLEMYPDRLAVSSPGGLYGNVRPDELMHVPASSSRNAALAKLLEDVTYPGSGKTVCENRGTGLLSVADMMRHAGLAEPTVTNRITQFTITLRNGAVPATAAPAVPRSNGTSAGRRRQLLDLLRGGPQTTAQLAAATGLQVVTIRHYLRELAQAGQVEPTEAKKRSRTNAWQIAATRRAV